MIAISIVLYDNNREVLKKTINSVIESVVDFEMKIYLIDNSPTDVLKGLVQDDKIEYLHNPSNPGFGAAHNIAIKKAIEEGAKYHFIVNPDVYFKDYVISQMVKYMDDNVNLGMIMPQILNEDGSIQNLPKLLPSPYSIVMRKLKRPVSLYNNFIDKYELRFVPQDKIYNAPILSGCFTLLNLEAIKEVGMFDDSYFMYFEDWDLSRRIHEKYKTIYYPMVSVYHGYESGANKSLKLFKTFIRSGIIYFSKWGCFFDKNRKRINNETLSQFK